MKVTSLPWARLVGPLAAAEDALARLDERLRTSAIAEGWRARTHYADAGASLWLEGELVHIEDLVLHEAGMDVRAPTHELTRARAVLAARRRVLAREPGWPFTAQGLGALRGHAGGGQAEEGRADPAPGADDEMAGALADLDAALQRAEAVVAGQAASRRDSPIYDLDWDEEERLAHWRARCAETVDLPPVLAAALAWTAWDDIEPLQHQAWLGRQLAAALLRARGKTRAHLACVNVGLRALAPERRYARGEERLASRIEAIGAAADWGLKEHDRWLLAREALLRKTKGRRSTSRLPELVELAMAVPLLPANLIAQRLRVTPRAAQDMVAELGLREATGRGRYRAWTVL